MIGPKVLVAPLLTNNLAAFNDRQVLRLGSTWKTEAINLALDVVAFRREIANGVRRRQAYGDRVESHATAVILTDSPDTQVGFGMVQDVSMVELLAAAGTAM